MALTQEDFDKLTQRELTSYCLGRLCIALGEGRFRDELVVIINEVQQQAFNRGSRFAKGLVRAEQQQKSESR